MRRSGDIVGISVCFSAGALTGEILKAYSESAAMVTYAVAAIVVLALAGLLLTYLILRHRTAGKAPIFAVMALAGLFCSAAGAVLGSDAFRWPLADRAGGYLKHLVDSIPFEGSDTASIVKAFLLGDRSGLTRETVATFRESGASHLLALSGLHVGIIYSLLSAAGRFLGNSPATRKVRGAINVFAVIFFTLMTGAGPSIVRAMLFIVIRELLILTGREAPPLNILFTALMVQVAINPGVMRTLGFQLSYLAVGGIFLLFPPLGRLYPWQGPVKKVWDASMLSLSCQVFTGPLVWLRFGTFPRYFLICNLLAIPLTTALIFSAAACITLAAGGCCPTAAVWICDSLTSALTWTLGVISRM